MANHEGIGRTNYFRVRDPESFRAAIATLSGVSLETEPEGRFCLLSDNPDGGGWSVTAAPADDTDADLDSLDPSEEEPLDLAEFLAGHLAEGEVAIIIESGHEQHSYCSGWALAVNAAGETRRVSLNDIYGLARELTDRPEDITVAEY
jgi:hypothetical protein